MRVITVVLANKMDVPVEFVDIGIKLQPKEVKSCFFPGNIPLSVKDAVKIGMISIVLIQMQSRTMQKHEIRTLRRKTRTRRTGLQMSRN